MPHHVRRNLLVLLSLAFLVIVLPVVLFVMKGEQDPRTLAQKASVLTFSPDSSDGNQLSVPSGGTVSLDIIVEPGANLVSFVKLVIQYDREKLEPASLQALSVNNDAFPLILEGPSYSPNVITAGLSIGNDPTKALSQRTKVGTITFRVKEGAEGTTLVSFSSGSEILSIAPGDDASENVLSSLSPAYIRIGNGSTQPTDTITTQRPSQSQDTSTDLQVVLRGIGVASPPRRPTRTAQLQLLDEAGEKEILMTSIPITYNQTTGRFIGSLNLQTVPKGAYILKVKTDQFLRKALGTPLQITENDDITIPSIILPPGDINNDNVLNVIDYALLIDCYSQTSSHLDCDQNKKNATDLNDDGVVDAKDYNLFFRELSNPVGD